MKAAAKLKHGLSFGINPEDFGARQTELNKESKYRPLPKKEHVILFQQKLKEHINDPNTERMENCTYKYEYDNPVIHFYNRKTRINVVVDKDTKNFRTGWKLKRSQIVDLMDNRNVGKLERK